MRIAVVGSGISGLSASLILHSEHEVHLFEKSSRFGGHSRTLEVLDKKTPDAPPTPVDTGFIVFNRRNYPNLIRLFDWLNLTPTKSSMSFAVSIDDGRLEYGTDGLHRLFAQLPNLFRLSYWRMLRDILRFNSYAEDYLESDLTLGECLRELHLGDWFRDYYLLAMGAAIWSAPPRQMLDFPASVFIRFFRNHGLLDISDRLQWYSLKGGSRTYVDAIVRRLPPAQLHLNAGIKGIERSTTGVSLILADGSRQQFDQLVLACHSDQALALLGDQASEAERSVLGAIRYQENEVILHQDVSLMPKSRRCWQSWVYLSESQAAGEPRVSLSYWMNNLQQLNTRQPLIVTLNPERRPDPSSQLDRWLTQHPVFDREAIAAQARLPAIQGVNRTWFCGAWTGYGFHEDGLLSAIRIAEQFGVRAPWEAA